MPDGRKGAAKLPLLRGIASLVESLKLGSEALRFSAEQMERDLDAGIATSMLNVLRAVVMDIPMAARYADEVSNLRISRIFGEFIWKHARNFFKRIFYNYYLRDMSLASIELPLGLGLSLFGHRRHPPTTGFRRRRCC